MWGLEFLRNVVALHPSQSPLLAFSASCRRTCSSLGGGGGEERNLWWSRWLHFLGGERRRKEACRVGWRGGSLLSPELQPDEFLSFFDYRTITFNEPRKCRSSVIPGGEAMAKSHRRCLLGAPVWNRRSSLLRSLPRVYLFLTGKRQSPLAFCTIPGVRSHFAWVRCWAFPRTFGVMAARCCLPALTQTEVRSLPGSSGRSCVPPIRQVNNRVVTAELCLLGFCFLFFPKIVVK